MQSQHVKLVKRMKKVKVKKTATNSCEPVQQAKQISDHTMQNEEVERRPAANDSSELDADIPVTPEATEPQDCNVLSPKESAIQILKESGVSPKEHPKIFKEITAFRTLTEHVSAVPKKMKLQMLKKINAADRNRCASYLGKQLNVHRKAVFSPRKTSAAYGKRIAAKRNKVTEFLKKPENSTMLPGKRDALAGGIQKYTLNDTIANLFNRFTFENPEYKISRSNFAKFRPLNT
jgi:hypothetical protein